MGEANELEFYQKLAIELTQEITTLKEDNNTLKCLVRALQATLSKADPEGKHAINETKGQKARTAPTRMSSLSLLDKR